MKQYLLFLLVHQMTAAMFRLIGAIGRIITIANVLAVFSLLTTILLGGFIISYGSIKIWWIWGYWISPLMYAQNAISVNEFLGKSWNQVIVGTNETLGVSILKSYGISHESKWYWIGAFALFGYVLLFNFLFTVSLSHFKPFENDHSTISEEILQEKGINKIEKLKSISRISKVEESTENERTTLILRPLSIAFENIRFSIDMPKEMKARGIKEDKLVLLKGVCGYFKPGVLTAMMGASGAGKTTLFDVLAGRKTEGFHEGTITISGYPKKQETFTRVLGYCEQNDIHSANMTVYESLAFSSWLRLPAKIDYSTRKMFIEEIMDLIELTSIRKTLVGLPSVNGLSTEQRKRLTIAVELVTNPSIIFMDEPTSGLDARAAAIVMRTIRNIAETNRTIVCTIHQPNVNIFESFDELLLLKAGEQIYFGPLGHHSINLISYFERIIGINKIRDGCNPAIWMLEVTATGQELLLGVNFSEVYKSSELYEKNKAIIIELSSPPHGSDDLHFSTQYPQRLLTQFIACFWKQHLMYWRNPSYSALRFFSTILIALATGTIFWDIGKKKEKQQDLMNAIGSMYYSVILMGVSYSVLVQAVVAMERSVFYRERAAKMYSAMPYAIGQVLIEQPYILIQSFLYSIIVYWMIGFEWSASKIIWYMFFTFWSFSYYTYYGMLMISISPNFSLASLVSNVFFNLWNIFSGFLIPRTSMPVWCRWYYWANPTAWTLYGIIYSQYGADKDLLDSNQMVAEFLKSHFGFNHDYLKGAAVTVPLFAVFFAILFGLAIKVLNFQKR